MVESKSPISQFTIRALNCDLKHSQRNGPRNEKRSKWQLIGKKRFIQVYRALSIVTKRLRGVMIHHPILQNNQTPPALPSCSSRRASPDMPINARNASLGLRLIYRLSHSLVNRAASSSKRCLSCCKCCTLSRLKGSDRLSGCRVRSVSVATRYAAPAAPAPAPRM